MTILDSYRSLKVIDLDKDRSIETLRNYSLYPFFFNFNIEITERKGLFNFVEFSLSCPKFEQLKILSFKWEYLFDPYGENDIDLYLKFQNIYDSNVFGDVILQDEEIFKQCMNQNLPGLRYVNKVKISYLETDIYQKDLIVETWKINHREMDSYVHNLSTLKDTKLKIK